MNKNDVFEFAWSVLNNYYYAYFDLIKKNAKSCYLFHLTNFNEYVRNNNKKVKQIGLLGLHSKPYLKSKDSLAN